MFQLIAQFGITLASILGDRLGHNSKDIVTVIEMFAALAAEGEDAKDELEALVAEIEELKESGQSLSLARMEELRARRAELSGDITAIRNRREAEDLERAVADINAQDDREYLAGVAGDDEVPQGIRDAAKARLAELGPVVPDPE